MVATAVAAAPSVIVRDASSNPVAGVSVTFTLTASGGTGGSIAPGTPATVVTDASGVATLSSWMLGQTSGTSNNTVTATASGVAGTVTFNASGAAGTAQHIVANSSTSQTGTVGTAVAAPSVLVRDAYNNPVSGVAVTFAVGAGAGTTAPASGASVTSSASGVAALTTWTLGTATGTNSVTASAATLAGSPLTFIASSTPGLTSDGQSRVIRTGANNIAADGSSSSTITVTVRDGFGNVIPGKSVSLARTGTTSAISPASGTSDANGQVAFSVTDPAAETVTYNATVTDGGAVGVVQTAQVTFVAATVSTTQSTVTASASPIAADGATTSTITVTLRDGQSNPVAGKTVTLSQGSGSSAITPSSSTSNASGVVTFDVTNTVAQSVTYTAIATDGTAIAISQTATVVFQAGAASSVIALTATSQTAAVGASVTAPSVRVRDAQSNPVSGVNVTFTLTANQGTGQINGGAGPIVVATDASGTASLTAWTLGNTAGTNTITAGTVVGTITFNATGTSSGAANIAVNGAPSTSATVGTSVASPPSVRVTDGSGNAVVGASVVFTLTASGGTGGAIAPVSAASVTTNASGIATLTSWTLGQTAGTNNNTVTATTSGVATTLTFDASGTAGAAQNIIANSALSQSAVAGSNVTAPPSVRVRDSFNNPVNGVAVTFTVGSGGGSSNPASGSTVSTDVTGTATLTSWTLGTAAGSNSVTANVTGLAGTPLTFSATGTVAVTSGAQSTVVRSGPNNVVADGSASSQITVTLRDANGNPVAGKSVSLDDAGDPSTISPASAASDANGQVTFNVTNTSAGTVTYTATATDGGAVAITPTAQVTFVLGTGYLVTAAANATAGSVVTVTAQLVDGSNNPVAQSGKTVAWSKVCSTLGAACPAGATGGSFATPISLTNASGRATVAFTVSTDATVDHIVTATDNDGLTAASGTIAVDAGPASLSHSTISATPTANLASDGIDASAVTIQLRDQFDNATTTGIGSGVDATLSGTATTASLTTFTTGGGGTYSASLTSTSSGTAIVSGRINAAAITHASNPVTITFIPVRLVMTSTNATPTAGVAENVTITVQDASNNTATSYSGVKNLIFSGASAAPDGTNPTVDGVDFGTSTPVTFTAGVATVSMALYRAEGPVDISVTTTAPTTPTLSTTGTDRLTVTVGDGGLNNFLLSLFSPQSNNTDFTLTNTLTARDAFQNIVTGFNAATDNVTFTSNAGLSTISGLGSGGNAVLNRATDFVNGVADLATGAVANANNIRLSILVMLGSQSVQFTAQAASGGSGVATVLVNP